MEARGPRVLSSLPRRRKPAEPLGCRRDAPEGGKAYHTQPKQGGHRPPEKPSDWPHKRLQSIRTAVSLLFSWADQPVK